MIWRFGLPMKTLGNAFGNYGRSMTETTPRYDAPPDDDLPKGVRFVLLAWFEKRFGPGAWGRVTVTFQKGEIVSWELAQTGKPDN